jgi:hypothetical protein
MPIKRRKWIYFVLCGIFFIGIFQFFKWKNNDPILLMSNEYGIITANGYIPDKETAIKIAKAIWIPIYGKKELFLLSYDVKLENGIWIIEGYNYLQILFNINGGGPLIKIEKNTGRILFVGRTG